MFLLTTVDVLSRMRFDVERSSLARPLRRASRNVSARRSRIGTRCGREARMTRPRIGAAPA